MIAIKQLTTTHSEFDQQLQDVLAWNEASDESIHQTVKKILAEVKQRGDAAVLDYTRQFDKVDVDAMAELVLPMSRINAALEAIPAEQKRALEKAAARIDSYHQHQKQASWSYTEADGTVLGQQVTALDKAGLYVPGGKAAYPSSVLMNAIPAKVAGVNELIMVVPTPHGQLNDLVLASAAIAGVDKVITIGGAQAIAALAYGTETIPKVDKIVGPGNIYVATAKGMVFGEVGIDMIAGPSEILIVCDGKTDPEWIAMDLFSQAEHDEDAQAILITDDAAFIEAVQSAMGRLLPTMARQEIIQQSLQHRAAFILVQDMNEAISVVNTIAPEHLELSVSDPMTLAKQVRHAGAIFMGRYTAESLGDYCAGPNHVLPTAKTARFSSPLGVYDFQKRSSLIQVSAEGATQLGETAAILAYGEGLDAHARSAEYRIKS